MTYELSHEIEDNNKSKDNKSNDGDLIKTNKTENNESQIIHRNTFQSLKKKLSNIIESFENDFSGNKLKEKSE